MADEKQPKTVTVQRTVPNEVTPLAHDTDNPGSRNADGRADRMIRLPAHGGVRRGDAARSDAPRPATRGQQRFAPAVAAQTVDAAKVRALRRAIAEGRYVVDAARIAAALLRADMV